MRAAVLKAQNKPLVIEDIYTPVPKEGEILVKVVACGVCHTDLHYIDHGVPPFKKLPIVLGHEASGIVETEGLTFKEGDRVLIPSVFTCGECESCRSGRANLCRRMIMPGNSIDGAFAQYIVVPEKDVMIMPDDISLEDGCIIADALSTPYHAVFNRAKVKAGDRAIVFGCGGVGINVVQFASLAGAEVIACDINENKLQKAKTLGAKYTINPEKEDLRQFLKSTGGPADIAFEVIGKAETIEMAYKSLGMGGRVCVVGYTNENITINPAKIMFYEQEIIGSIGCSPNDYPTIIEMVRTGKVQLKPLIANKYSLDDINISLDELRQGKVLRNIILPNGRGQDPLFP